MGVKLAAFDGVLTFESDGSSIDFCKRDIGRARKVLKDHGIKVFRPQGRDFGGEFVVQVNSEDFERAKQLLASAGIQVTHTR
jgi:hypothetical protein